MFNKVLVFVFLILFCGFSTVNANWSYGQDIDPSTFNWNDVPANFTDSFFFVDYSNNTIKLWKPKRYIVTDISANFIVSHCSTSGGTRLKHDHIQNDFDSTQFSTDNLIPAYFEADEFWDRYFYSPSICGRVYNATNGSNCFSFAAACNLDGYYAYSISPTQMTTALGEEASSSPSTPYQEQDIIYYPNDPPHASVIGEVYGSEIEMIYWKYRASGLYYLTNFPTGSQIDELDTPSNCLGVNGAGDILFMPGGWKWDGAGDGASATVWRPD